MEFKICSNKGTPAFSKKRYNSKNGVNTQATFKTLLQNHCMGQFQPNLAQSIIHTLTCKIIQACMGKLHFFEGQIQKLNITILYFTAI